MSADWARLPVLAVVFLATLIRSAFGFGEAVVEFRNLRVKEIKD
jgi:hypothetical protein